MTIQKMEVTGLWRYPVKSMLGERCQNLELDARGAKGDRLYAVRDLEGKLGSGKNSRRFRKMDRLLAFSAVYESEAPVISFPDGTTIRAGDPNIDAALSSALGRPVSLAREGEISHFDAASIHLVTTGSLDWLRRRLPAAAIDERRFRPNLVVDVPGHQPLEQDWVGKTAIIGNVKLKFQDPTERCVMVTLPQSELRFEPEVLRCIAQELELQFGVYAQVLTAGRIGCGDEVVLVDD